MPASDRDLRYGAVAILGRHNVGKSTLLNRFVGEKLAIVTPKPQTTRVRLLGIWNGSVRGAGGTAEALEGQIAFVDTPGVHRPCSALGRFMVGEALGALDEVDAALLIVDGSGGHGGKSEAEDLIIEWMSAARKSAVLAINKVDLVKDKARLLPLIQEWSATGRFAAVVPISATQGIGINELLAELLLLLPHGPPAYEPEVVTDRHERFFVAELVREELFLRLRQELPYAVAVEIDAWQERPQGDVVVDAAVLVAKESQKSIVLGKGGRMIREVGTAARAQAAVRLGRPVHLRLHVKVAPAWTASPAALARLGYGKTG